MDPSHRLFIEKQIRILRNRGARTKPMKSLAECVQVTTRAMRPDT